LKNCSLIPKADYSTLKSMAGATAFIRQAAVVSFNHLDLFGGDQAIRKLVQAY
jgi:hypothetical protein